MKPTTIFLISLVLVGAFRLKGQAQPLDDPGVPTGEKLVFKQTVGKDVSTLTISTEHKTWKGREVYEVTSSSPDQEILYRVGRPGMDQLFSLIRDNKPETTIERQTAILRNTIKTADDEIALLDFLSLDFLLRGYPLGQVKSLKVRVAGQNSMNMSININRLPDAVLTVEGTKVPCFHLEMSMTGVMGALFPKTSFWYALAAPHYLVRFEGIGFGPGSPKRVLELTALPAK